MCTTKKAQNATKIVKSKTLQIVLRIKIILHIINNVVKYINNLRREKNKVILYVSLS